MFNFLHSTSVLSFYIDVVLVLSRTKRYQNVLWSIRATWTKYLYITSQTSRWKSSVISWDFPIIGGSVLFCNVSFHFNFHPRSWPSLRKNGIPKARQRTTECACLSSPIFRLSTVWQIAWHPTLLPTIYSNKHGKLELTTDDGYIPLLFIAYTSNTGYLNHRNVVTHIWIRLLSLHWFRQGGGGGGGGQPQIDVRYSNKVRKLI